jgi:hypothetical protein
VANQQTVKHLPHSLLLLLLLLMMMMVLLVA